MIPEGLVPHTIAAKHLLLSSWHQNPQQPFLGVLVVDARLVCARHRRGNSAVEENSIRSVPETKIGLPGQPGLLRWAIVSYDEGMQPPCVLDLPATSPTLEGRFSRIAFLLALAISPVVGAVWAWAAEAAQCYVAPFLLFPVLVGVFAGLTIVGLIRFAQIGHRPTVLLAVVLAAGTAACGQHYLEYLSTYSRIPAMMPEKESSQVSAQDVRASQRELRPSFLKYLAAQASRGRPLLGGYVASGLAAWLSWAIDVLLTVAAAVAVTLPAVRIPYCNRCGTWYRTVRNGKIDVPTARRLAETCNVDETAAIHSPRYRLSSCQGGCGPMRCELSWETSDGAVDLVRVWLDAEKRNRIATILDGIVADDK